MTDTPYPIFDADNHYYEALDAFTRHMDPGMASRGVQWAQINGRDYHIVGGKFSRAVTRLKPWTQRVDKLLKPRLQGLVNPLSQRLIALLAVVLALSMIPLELLPFAAALPALAITLMGLGLAASAGLPSVSNLSAISNRA